METVTDPYILQELRKYYSVHSPRRNSIFRYMKASARLSHAEIIWDKVQGLAERQWKTRINSMMSTVKFPEIYVSDTEHELVIRVARFRLPQFLNPVICFFTTSKICLRIVNIDHDQRRMLIHNILPVFIIVLYGFYQQINN